MGSTQAVGLTGAVEEPQWNSRPAWKLPGWAEPVMVASILFGAMILTRKRGFRIFRHRERPSRSKSILDIDSDDARTSDDLLGSLSDSDDDVPLQYLSERYPPKIRSCMGMTKVRTPNTSRYRHHLHSRILQRFPFLIEMFYWIINYAFYRMTAVLSARLFAGVGIWKAAQSHGITVLEMEEQSPLSFLFPIAEKSVQQWFMHGHQDALTVLNKAYALIHIPGTVGFIAWYYYAAPSFHTFAQVRRILTLTNFMAFVTFIFYPCMPPRLLPKEYGFLDTVRHDDAQSVWMSGKYVNSLAAMPSMHFGYAFCIGATLIYHSGITRRNLERFEVRKNAFWKAFYLAIGIGYPTLILTCIIATANHYFLDAGIATMYVFIAFFCNKIFFVFIPLEDWLLWAIRADKPMPSTGERFHARGGRL